MQNDQDTVEVEDSISTEDTTPQGNLTSDDLLNFIEETAQESAQPEPDVQEEPETESEEGSEDVLSQSNEDENVDVEDEDDSDPDEPEPPKSVQKLLRQVGKLTARAKSAEERYESLESQFQELQKKTPEQEQKTNDINKIETMEELETLRQEALSARKWARKHEGEQFVEENGNEFDAKQIKEIRDNAEDYLDELIPERQKFLQERHQSNELADQTFSFIRDTESPEHQLLKNIDANEKFAVLDQLPNALYIKSLIVEGCKVVKDRDQGKVAKATKAQVKKPAPPSAPVSDVSPPQQTKKDHRKVLGDGNVSEDQLVAFLST